MAETGAPSPPAKKLKTDDDGYDEDSDSDTDFESLPTIKVMPPISFEEESDSDDEFFAHGPGLNDPEEVSRYRKMVEESEGFNVDSFPNVRLFEMIVPADESDRDMVLEGAKRAIETINKDLNTNLTLMEGEGAVKSNIRCNSGTLTMYTTFKAKDQNTGEIVTYETEVMQPMSSFVDYYVYMYRQKQTTSDAEEGNAVTKGEIQNKTFDQGERQEVSKIMASGNYEKPPNLGCCFQSEIAAT